MCVWLVGLVNPFTQPPEQSIVISDESRTKAHKKKNSTTRMSGLFFRPAFGDKKRDGSRGLPHWHTLLIYYVFTSVLVTLFEMYCTRIILRQSSVWDSSLNGDRVKCVALVKFSHYSIVFHSARYLLAHTVCDESIRPAAYFTQKGKLGTVQLVTQAKSIRLYGL